MTREKKRKADSLKILRCEKKSGVRRDYETEDRLLRQAQDAPRSASDLCGWDRHMSRDDYEDLLLDYSASHWDSHIEKDDWTGDLTLRRYQTWYEYTLRVTYTVNGRTYEQDADYESRCLITEEDRASVWFDPEHPERISRLYVLDAADRMSSMLVFGLAAVLAAVLLLTSLVLYFIKQ